MADIGGLTGSSAWALPGRRIDLSNADSPLFKAVTLSATSTIDARCPPILMVSVSGANRDLGFSADVEKTGGFQLVYNAGSTYSAVIKNSAGTIKITLAPGELWAAVWDTDWITLFKVTASSVPTISPTTISLTDNQAAALDFLEAANSYLKFVTSNGAEKVVVGKLLSLLSGALLADAAASPTVEGQLLYNADHLELHDGTAARSILMSDDIGVTVQAYSAVLTALATYGLDRQVSATIAVADSATNDAALTLQLNRLDGSTAIAAARQVMIVTSTTQYAPAGQPEASVTFGTATVGSIIASGQGWALVETDATGAFACTATNTDNETIYFFTQTAARLSDVSKGCGVVASNTDAATWS